MINLHQIVGNMPAVGWLVVLVALLVWGWATYYMGEVSERKWGDRESGALIGFFVPGLLIVLGLQFIH